MSSRWLLSLVALLVLSSVASAQATMLELIPENAVGAAAVRSIDELQKKGDKFVEDCKLEIGLARPSILFTFIFNNLGIQAGFDLKAPAAIIVLPPLNKDDRVRLFDNFERLVVLAIPVADAERMAGNFALKADDLKPGKIAQVNRNNWGKYLAGRGKHLFLTSDESTLKRYLEAKPLAGLVPEKRRTSLNDADVVLHLDPRPFGGEWTEMLRESERFLGKSDDPQEQKLLFVAALKQVRFGLAGIRVGEGLGISFTTYFEKDGKEARDFLDLLRAGARPAGLQGLPEGRVIVAQAQGGDGAKNGIIAKLIFDSLLRGVLESKHIISATDRPAFAGVFAEIWHQLRGSRLGVYLTSDESRLGLFSLVAILEAEDPARFVATMRVLARIAEGSDLDLAKKPKNELVDLEKLVRDLGDTVYRVREAASLRLRLVGEPALAHLQKAIDSADLETRRRAQLLHAQISQVAAERRKELLSKDLPRFVRPKFAFVAKAEARADTAIDIIKIQLSERDRLIAGQMEQLLGPDWDKLRLGIHGKRIVVLLGSETELFEQTLRNLKEGKEGLAVSKKLGDFVKHGDPQRAVEFHVGVENLLALVNAPRAGQPRPSGLLTSFALTAAEDHLHLDLWVPTAEIRTVVKERKW